MMASRPDDPVVSVVIPAYDRAHLVSDAIRSVLVQTVKNIEILVVDDGSSDNTAEVVGAFGAQVTLLRQANQGVAAARNTGIKHARAPFIAFLDSDDVWLEDKLQRQLDFMQTHSEIGLLYGQMWSYDVSKPEDKRIDPYVVAQNFDDLLNGPNAITTSTVMVRRTCFERCGLYDEAFPAAEDHELWLRIADQFEIAFMQGPVAEYRRHDQNFRATPVRVWEGYRKLYATMLERYTDRLRDKRSTTHQLAKFEYLCGAHALRQGDVRKARQLIRSALKRCPALGSMLSKDNHSVLNTLWLNIKPYLAWVAASIRSS